jgi:three-Cys-motif partner protein
MTEPVLWSLDDHTRAKHQVLRKYLDGWIPIMGQQALKVSTGRPPALLLVDGFAGPGRYTGGEPGSPLIMLDALASHTALPRIDGVAFHFLFIEQDERRFDHLQGEIAKVSLPSNVVLHMHHGEFEPTFGTIVDGITSKGKQLIPTFAFIDPFGYTSASISLTGRFLEFQRSEALFFLPLSFIHRFVGRDGQEAALTGLFNTEEWRQAIPLEGVERRDFLVDLFERQLASQGRVRHTRSFQLRTRDGNDYRLVFATDHDKGLEVMKQAMWKVDPVEGTGYVAQTETGQLVLFKPEVDTGPLLEELRQVFEGRWFSVDDAYNVTLLRTPFLQSHLKTKTLKPAEKAGLIEVDRSDGSRAGSYGDGVRIRFT